MRNAKWMAGCIGVAAGAALVAAWILTRSAPPPAPSVPPAAGATQQQADASPPACTDTAPQPLDPASITGIWVDEDGNDQIQVAQKDANDKTHFTMKGDHDWEGIYAGGKLTFTRKAAAAEMEHTAPDWARKQVEGQIEWSLELEPRSVCDSARLHGKWYPGRIKIEEGLNAGGGDTVSRGDVSADGKGEPREVDYIKAPKILVFAEGRLDSFIIDKLYVGIPLSVGVVFETPYEKDNYPVRIIVGGQKLALSAVPANGDRTLFKTATFEVKP